MPHPARISPLQKNHAALWYSAPLYRLAWTALPQAIVALFFAVFVIGSGVSDALWDRGSKTGNPPPGDWGKPVETGAAEEHLNTLRDAVGDNSAPGNLAVLQDLATLGNAMASLKLAELYNPLQAAFYPFPAEKDAQRALDLFQTGMEAGITHAYGGVAALRLWPGTALYDPSLGCPVMEAFITKIQAGPKPPAENDAWHMMQAADCYSGLQHRKGAPLTGLTAEAAQRAIDLYQDPLLSSSGLADRGLAQVYMSRVSPLRDPIKGCEKARAWIKAEGVNADQIDTLLPAFLVEAGNCVLGVGEYGATGGATGTYVPTIAEEETALALWSSPSAASNAELTGLVAWFQMNTDNLQTAVPELGCDAAQRWADLSGGAVEEIDKLSNWTVVQIAKCLTGQRRNSGTSPLTQTQRDIGLKAMDHLTSVTQSTLAMYEMAYILSVGAAGIPEDDARARNLYQDCIKIGGVPECNYGLGLMKRWGEGGFDVDYEGAANEFNFCADAGIAACHAQLVDVWDISDSPRLQNQTSVVSHLEASVAGNDDYGLWLYALAVYNGKYGLKPDDEAAAILFVKCIEASFDTRYIDSLKNTIGPQIKSKAFWRALHQDLKRRGIYDGKIADQPTDAGFAALARLLQ